jgi:hypothetical protein
MSGFDPVSEAKALNTMVKGYFATVRMPDVSDPLMNEVQAEWCKLDPNQKSLTNTEMKRSTGVKPVENGAGEFKGFGWYANESATYYMPVKCRD